MKIDREPDEVIEHLPIQCEGCLHAGACRLRCCETRYEYEAIVKTKPIAHKVLDCKAFALTGEATQGTFLQHITGARQYGPGLAGLAVSLLTIGYMSVNRGQKLLKSLRIPVSSSAIQDMLTKATRLVKAPVERICQTVTQLTVTHLCIRSCSEKAKLNPAALRDVLYRFNQSLEPSSSNADYRFFAADSSTLSSLRFLQGVFVAIQH